MANQSTQPPWVPFPTNHINDALEANLAVFDNSDMEPQMRGVLHRHDFHELMYLEHGEALFFSDFQQYELSAGTLLFISPGQLHAWRGNWERFALKVIMFRINALNNWTRRLMSELPYDKTTVVPFFTVPPERCKAIEFHFMTALQHFRCAPMQDKGLLFAYLNVLLAEAVQQYEPTKSNPSTNAAEELTQSFQQAVDAHFHHRLKVQEYAEMLGVSLNHLVETVRLTTGQTPKRMVQERLLLEAKRLLVHTQQPINAISDVLTFQNASQFSRWFRNGVGTTPNQFRAGFELP